MVQLQSLTGTKTNTLPAAIQNPNLNLAFAALDARNKSGHDSSVRIGPV